MKDDTLTITDAARVLGITRPTVYKRQDLGELPLELTVEALAAVIDAEIALWQARRAELDRITAPSLI